MRSVEHNKYPGQVQHPSGVMSQEHRSPEKAHWHKMELPLEIWPLSVNYPDPKGSGLVTHP